MSGPGWVGKSPTTTAFVLGMGLIGGALVGFKVQVRCLAWWLNHG